MQGMSITTACLPLRELLFQDGPEGPALHAHHRRTITADLFRHRPEAPAEERWRLAYTRLRHIDAELPCTAEELVRNPRQLAALHEWTSVVDGGTTSLASIHYNLFLGSLLADTESAPRDLTPYTSLDQVGTFLCTEFDHGNDAAALETTATYDIEADEFVLNTPHAGATKYMPNTGPAGGPKTGVVAARLLVAGRDEGVFLFLTPLTDEYGPLPGVKTEPLPPRVGSPVDHCVTSFTDVRLPRTALLQGPHGRLERDGTVTSPLGSPRKRFLTSIGRVTVGKLCMSASTLGGARAALAIAVRYARVRKVSGPGGQSVPIAAYRSHHGRLLERTATAYAMTFLHREVMNRWVTHAPDELPYAERLVAIAKGWITYQARDILTEARERCGARGLFPANGLAEFQGNAEGAITAEGDNLAVWSKAGAEMLFGHEVTPAPPRATGDEDAMDVTFLRQALSAAERHWHLTARAALRGTTGTAPAPGAESPAFTRWNNASAPALELVETYALGQASDAFAQACARTDDPALPTLHRLFLLRHLRPYEGLLLASGALTADQVRAFPAARAALTARLAPELARLTEAFWVPEEHLLSLPMLAG